MGKILHRRRTDVAWTLLNEFPCHGVVIQRDNSMTVRTLTVFINEALLNRPLWPADTQTRSFQKSSWENIVKLILMGNFWRWLSISSDFFDTKINLRQDKRQYETAFGTHLTSELSRVKPNILKKLHKKFTYLNFNGIKFKSALQHNMELKWVNQDQLC